MKTRFFDIYMKCQECGREVWIEHMDDMDLGCPYETGDTGFEYCPDCKKQTIMDVIEVEESDWTEDEED